MGLEDPLEKETATHSRILAWKLRGNSLAGYSPWGCKESDTTERLGKQATWHVSIMVDHNSPYKVYNFHKLFTRLVHFYCNTIK